MFIEGDELWVVQGIEIYQMVHAQIRICTGKLHA